MIVICAIQSHYVFDHLDDLVVVMHLSRVKEIRGLLPSPVIPVA